MNLKQFLIILLSTLIGIIPLTIVASTNDSLNLSQEKQVIVVSKTGNQENTEASLNKYTHKKIKVLTNYKGAEVVQTDNIELARMKLDKNIEIFEDAKIKVSKPNKLKKNSVQQIPWGVSRVGANKAWINTTGKGIRVAVVDSGIAKHKDLNKNIKGGFNAINPGKPAIDDFGHGTHTAGIIAAINDKVGVVGVAPDAELYAVKVLDEYGSGNLSDLVDGINWCIKNRIQVINLSLEIQDDLPLLRKIIKRALDAGLIVVSAAGNNDGGSTLYPAAYKGVIAVSAIDNSNNIAGFSAIGKIDFCAPGVDIYSTYIENDYTTMSGTSMAAPHVTGIIALMLADIRNDIDHNGIVSTKEVLRIIKKYVEDIGPSGYDNIFGNGILKAISLK